MRCGTTDAECTAKVTHLVIDRKAGLSLFAKQGRYPYCERHAREIVAMFPGLWYMRRIGEEGEITGSSETPNIDELLGLGRRLVALLEDPHPGLSTWCGCVDSVLTKIDAFHGGSK